jgi:hypothetical protein
MEGTTSTAGRWSGGQRACVAIHAALAAALVPAYVLLAPPAHWQQPVILSMLAVMAVVVDRHDIPLPAGIRFDALIAVALIAVAIGGPLPAFAIALVPMLVNAVTGHERLVRAGNLANLAAYGWYTLAGGLMLQAVAPDPTAPEAIGWLVVVGLVQLLVNWAVGPAIYGPLWLGRPFRAFVEMLMDAIPAGSVMVALGATSVFLVGPLDVLALALFAAIAVLPGSFLTYAARTRSVTRLERGAATRRYAYALAVQLGLGRAERRHLAEVAAAARRRPPTGEPLDYVRATIGSFSRANHDAQLLTEWWDGRGGPIGLRGEAIPVATRLVAVADAWSGLTAAGTPQLGHEEALAQLEHAGGARFDPAIVRAARAVIAQERVTDSVPAPEPRLHLLRLPAPLRRALAAG